MHCVWPQAAPALMTSEIMMLTFEYGDKAVFREAMAAIDRKEPFALVVTGSKRPRVLKGIGAYYAFHDCFVIRGHKNLSVLLRFSYHVLWAIDFWLLCLYKQSPNKRIEFKNEQNVVTVFFGFQGTESEKGQVLH